MTTPVGPDARSRDELCELLEESGETTVTIEDVVTFIRALADGIVPTCGVCNRPVITDDKACLMYGVILNDPPHHESCATGCADCRDEMRQERRP